MARPQANRVIAIFPAPERIPERVMTEAAKVRR
jgi:hypothetical protein